MYPIMASRKSVGMFLICFGISLIFAGSDLSHLRISKGFPISVCFHGFRFLWRNNRIIGLFKGFLLNFIS